MSGILIGIGIGVAKGVLKDLIGFRKSKIDAKAQGKKVKFDLGLSLLGALEQVLPFGGAGAVAEILATKL